MQFKEVRLEIRHSLSKCRKRTIRLFISLYDNDLISLEVYWSLLSYVACLLIYKTLYIIVYMYIVYIARVYCIYILWSALFSAKFCAHKFLFSIDNYIFAKRSQI